MRKGIMILLVAVVIIAVPKKVKAAEVDEFEYLTRCVQAEAGNQGFFGKRLVAAVILNRVEDERFPNTIVDVINAPHQFAVVANGSIKTVTVDEETIDACRIEMAHRSRTDIKYFNNSSAVSGEFCFKWGGHWFGK